MNYIIIYWIWESAFTDKNKLYAEIGDDKTLALATFEKLEDAKKYIEAREKEYEEFWQGTQKMKCRVISIKGVEL